MRMVNFILKHEETDDVWFCELDEPTDDLAEIAQAALELVSHLIDIVKGGD